MKIITGGVCAAQGFTANGIHCGIRRNRTKRDLSLICSEVPASAAAVYTTNLVKGAPLTVTKKHIADGKARAILCNSGNANTCNADGEEIAVSMCRALAETMGIAAITSGFVNQMLPSKNRRGKEKAGAICRNISLTSGIIFFRKGRLRSISLAKA